MRVDKHRIAPLVHDEGVEQPKIGVGGNNLKNTPSNTKLTKQSVRRLAELEFDPIERAVRLYDQLEMAIYEMKFNDDGTEKSRYNAIAYAQLMNAKAKVINDLMRYGYGRVPETTMVEHTELPPLIIRTTKPGDEEDYDVEPEGPFKGDDE
jgi:hypothetical protein